MAINATFLFSGMSDYWGGDGDRWDDNKGCLFAYYSTDTTVRDIIDGLVSDFEYGGDCDSLPEDVTSEDIRAALLDMLSDAGRADYETDALSEFAIEFASVNGYEAGVPLDEQETESYVCDESPVVIVLIEVDVCEECGEAADHVVDELCEACAVKHGYSV